MVTSYVPLEVPSESARASQQYRRASEHIKHLDQASQADKTTSSLTETAVFYSWLGICSYVCMCVYIYIYICTHICFTRT